MLMDSEVGLTLLVQHKIDTGDAKPIKMCTHRLSLAHQEAAGAEQSRRCSGPRTSGVVMVSKKWSPKMRFWVHLRLLNSVTKKDLYSLPSNDECLDKPGLHTGSA